MTTPSKPSFVESFSDELFDIAGSYVRQGGVRVSVKTNLGPELPIFSGTGEGGGLASKLGLKAGVIVRSQDGSTIATYGDPAPTEPIKVIALAIVLGVIGIVLIRGVLPK